MRSLPPRSALCVALALWGAGPACQKSREAPGKSLCALVPTLKAELAWHIEADDEATFRAYARSVGPAPLARAAALFLISPPTRTAEEFLAAEQRIAPAHARLAEVLLAEFHAGVAKRNRDAYWSYSVAERMNIVARLQEASRLSQDPSLPAGYRAEQINALLADAERPDIFNYSDLYGVLAELMEELRRPQEIPGILQQGIDAAFAAGDTVMACQHLGTLGYHYLQTGDFEAMRQAWDRGLALARSCRSWQEARILSFYGGHYRSQGRLAITRDLVLEARDRCQELDASNVAARFVVDALAFFARLECWDAVGDGLDHAARVLEKDRASLSPRDEVLAGTRLQVLRAGYRASVGDCAEARRSAHEAAETVAHWDLGTPRAVAVRLDAASVLRMCGHAEEARSLLEWCVTQCRDVPIPDRLDIAVNDLARIDLDLGDLAACRAVLTSAEPAANPLQELRRAVLQVRVEVASGDRPAAFSSLHAALARLDAWTAAGGGSVDDDIALASYDELRQIAHDLLADVPEAAYAFEMRWRSPAMRRPRFDLPALSEAEFVEELARSSQEVCARLAEERAIHCLYDVREDAVVRFTASASGVRRERLGVTPSDLRKQVEAVCDRFVRPVPVRASKRDPFALLLRDLGKSLLPDDVCAPESPNLVLVTANRWLDRLPFEALGVDETGNEPLLARHDVARVRYWSTGQAAARDSALVVWEPTCSDVLRRRYSILGEQLPSSAREAAAACEWLPHVIALSGPAATKQRIVASWERARVLYFAGHVVQDPEVPWVTFLPMAQSPKGHEDDSYLEASDVRKADLSGCRLAVLSSCGSGAPYTSGVVAAPSLADAFLDAGAHAVVSTGWAVGDADADRTMRAFMREIVEQDMEPIRALCSVRREQARAGVPMHQWAAFSISIGRLNREPLDAGLATTTDGVAQSRPVSSPWLDGR